MTDEMMDYWRHFDYARLSSSSKQMLRLDDDDTIQLWLAMRYIASAYRCMIDGIS
jgi:hypothetical protein